MTHIKITRGLDIPISGKPADPTDLNVALKELPSPLHIALNLAPFEETKFKVLVKPGEVVKIGDPIVLDKSQEDRVFISPAAGLVKEIRRGFKRRLLNVVIELDKDENYHEFQKLDPASTSRDDLIKRMLEGGIFGQIRSRPFNLLANPYQSPRCIFVKALESAPFVPPAEYQVMGYEEEFQMGLTALSKLTDGQVHLVYRAGTPFRAFTDAQDVTKHTAEGPHPISNASLHIQRIHPIKKPEDIVWTLTAHDVVCLGHLLSKGRAHIHRVISIGGPGIVENRTGYFKARAGFPINQIISDRIPNRPTRFISGDPLMGVKVTHEDFLIFDHFVFTALPEHLTREFLHFFRLGTNKYSFSRTYISGFLKEKAYDFDTNRHGEHRAFIDNTLYDKVQPLHIPTMQLVKAILAENYDLAEEYGLLEVDAEDFALPTFVCPSKMEMTEIVKGGLKDYSKEVLG